MLKQKVLGDAISSTTTVSIVAELGVGFRSPKQFGVLILPMDKVKSGFIVYCTKKLDLPRNFRAIYKGRCYLRDINSVLSS